MQAFGITFIIYTNAQMKYKTEMIVTFTLVASNIFEIILATLEYMLKYCSQCIFWNVVLFIIPHSASSTRYTMVVSKCLHEQYIYIYIYIYIYLCMMMRPCKGKVSKETKQFIRLRISESQRRIKETYEKKYMLNCNKFSNKNLALQGQKVG